MMKNGIRLRTIGRTQELPESTQQKLRETIAATADNKATTLILALNYSSRTEITDAVRSICAAAPDPATITPETISAHLYTAEYPDPDLLIRTSGEMRLSNFLLWQLSYSEFYITPKFWPDFSKEDLRAAVAEFQKRERRFGGL